MAHTPFYHKRKLAGYLSGYRFLPALVAVFIVPFGGLWTIPISWDISLTQLLVGLAVLLFASTLLFREEEVRIGRKNYRVRSLLTVLVFVALALIMPFGDERWRVDFDETALNAYMLLLVLTVLAPITDVLDGHFARKYPVEYDSDGRTEDFFIFDNGKDENDRPNAAYFVAVPVALVVRFFLEQLHDWDAPRDSEFMFWVSLVFLAFLGLGTLVFELGKKNAIPHQAVSAEVAQGWLAGLFYALIPLVFAVLAFAHWSWVWQAFVYGAVVLGSIWLAYHASDRWFDRPESSPEYQARHDAGTGNTLRY